MLVLQVGRTDTSKLKVFEGHSQVSLGIFF